MSDEHFVFLNKEHKKISKRNENFSFFQVLLYTEEVFRHYQIMRWERRRRGLRRVFMVQEQFLICKTYPSQVEIRQVRDGRKGSLRVRGTIGNPPTGRTYLGALPPSCSRWPLGIFGLQTLSHLRRSSSTTSSVDSCWGISFLWKETEKNETPRTFLEYFTRSGSPPPAWLGGDSDRIFQSPAAETQGTTLAWRDVGETWTADRNAGLFPAHEGGRRGSLRN